MRMEDVNEFDEMNSNSANVGKNNISDDEFIKRSLESMQQKRPIQEVEQEKVKNPSQSLAQAMSSMVDYNDLNNSNYWKIDNLPSRGLLYPEGTVILGRPLKVIEVKKLSSLTDGNADFIIKDILRRTIKGINIDDIYIADKLFLILWLRANSFRDSSYVTEFHCDKCGCDSDFHFDIDNIEIQYLSDEYLHNNGLKLQSGHSIKIKFLTIGDSDKIERFKEVNKGTFMEFDSELLTIASMISEIDGSSKSLLERYQFVLGLDPQDFSLIVSYIDKFGMGLKPFMNVKCNKCGGTSQMAITFHKSFFFPSYKFE